MTNAAALPTATPTEIDAEIARLSAELAEQAAIIERAEHRIQATITRRYYDETYHGPEVERLHAVVGQANQVSAELRAALAPLHAEFERRDGWTRYYLVDNADGHVHFGTGCSTCFSSTRYRWLTSESGTLPAHLVEKAGERACTTCFSWAPVNVLKRRSVFRSTSEDERAAREAERAAKRQAAAAKAITTPDGLALFTVELGAHGALRNGDELRTEVAAWRAAMYAAEMLAFYGSDSVGAAASTETLRRCVEAVAAKRGVTVESLRAEITKKTAAKARKGGWEVKA